MVIPMRKSFIIFTAAAMYMTAAVTGYASDESVENETEAVSELETELNETAGEDADGIAKDAIADFRGFAWGMTQSEVEAELQEAGEEYEVFGAEELEEEFSFENPSMISQGVVSLAGYLASPRYLFKNQKLIIGVYNAGGLVEQNEMPEELYQKYVDVYGEPIVPEDPELAKTNFLWKDAENNWIYMNQNYSIILYVSGSVSRSDFLSVFGAEEEDMEMFGFDIYEVLGIADAEENYEGI